MYEALQITRSASWLERESGLPSSLTISKSTEVKTEVLIFPLSSLVAEFGGTLGLFLGFSFMTLWDKINLLGTTN